MRLTLKLTIALMTVILAVLAVFQSFEIKRDAEELEREMRRDQAVAARSLAVAFGELMRAGGPASARRLLQQSDPGDDDFRVRWTAGGSDAPAAPPECLAAAARGGLATWEGSAAAGAPGRLFTCVQVVPGDPEFGAIEVSHSLSHVRQYVRRTIVWSVGISVIMLAIAGLLTAALGVVFVGRPIRRLMDKARRVGAGDFSGRLELDGRDEIAQLAGEMNTMSDLLAAARAEVDAAVGARVAALEQLRHAERLSTIGTLAAGVAHELGTPLQVVSGRARMIGDGEVSGGDVAANARIIHEQAQRMARIIRQLLDFARRRGPRKTRCDLRQLTTQTLALVAPLAERKRATLRMLQGAPADAEIDADQIQQVVTNLVVNAVDAMPGGGTVTVDVHAASAEAPADVGGVRGEYLALSVRDQGVGMSAETIARVFEPFFTTKPLGEATGLGLSVAHGIVREHGGWITVESAPGEGSSFTLHLPRSS